MLPCPSGYQPRFWDSSHLERWRWFEDPSARHTNLHWCQPLPALVQSNVLYVMNSIWRGSNEFSGTKKVALKQNHPKRAPKKKWIDVISDLCHKLPGPGWHDAATRAKTRLSEKVGQAVMTLSPSKGIQNPKPRLAVFKLPWRESKMAGPSPNLQHHTLSPKLQRLTDASSKVLHGKKAMTALKKLKLLRIRNLPKDRSRSRVAGPQLALHLITSSVCSVREKKQDQSAQTLSTISYNFRTLCISFS